MTERKAVHCPTCCCSQRWEIASHHLVQVLVVAAGIIVAVLTMQAVGIHY